MSKKSLALMILICAVFVCGAYKIDFRTARWQEEEPFKEDNISNEEKTYSNAGEQLAISEAEEERISPLLHALDNSPLLDSKSGELRKFPYPYKAMLSISSDSDSTTVEAFERMHRFLNTFEDTPYGKGLGLDIGDSFFFYNGSDYDTADNLLTYCAGVNPNELQDGKLIKKYYDCGWIDSIHSFGDFSNSGETLFSRELGIRAWEILNEADIHPTVWIDHGTATNVQNFGAYNPFNGSNYQMGDNPRSEYYHTDITLSNSVNFAWYSRHSDQFGYDFPMALKEFRDSGSTWSFHRYTSEMIGNTIDWTWLPNRLHDQITTSRLDALEENGQYSIVAQHITSFQQEYQPGEADIEALRLLAERFHQNKSILVARTSRLLNYAVTQKYLSYQIAKNQEQTGIRIVSILDPVTGSREPLAKDLAGITFYCDNPEEVVVFIGDTMIEPQTLIKNDQDFTGRKSVSIPWFEQDTFDYTTK